MGGVAAGIIVIRPDGGGDTGPGTTSPQNSARAPRAGKELTFTTPEGYSYALAAVTAGTRAAAGGTGGVDKSTVAYADYVLTNKRQEAILLDFPADLFIRRAKVGKNGAGRCMPQPGTAADVCTLPNQSRVVTALNGSKPLTGEQGGVRYMPPGSSYLVRVTTDFPVAADTVQSDIKLYVWNVRFKPDRKAVEIPFP